MLRRRMLPLLCLALLLAGCTWSFPGSPSAGDAPGDLSVLGSGDPNEGGGIGDEAIPLTAPPPADPPTFTPAPSPTAAEDGSPRLDAPALTAGATLAPLGTAEATVPLAVVVTATTGPATVDPGAELALTVTPTLTVSAESQATAPLEPTPTPLPLTHVIAAGETLYRIGEQYGLSWVAIAELNGITNADQITAGQELRLPQPTPPVEVETNTPEPPAAEATETPPAQTSETRPATETPAPRPETHTVAPGDSLYRISQLYGVSWVEIAEANGLTTANQIYVGQVLKIPVSLPGPTPSFTHQVRAGETVFRIALQYGVPLAALVEANGLQPPYVIYPGQQLAIPTGDDE